MIKLTSQAEIERVEAKRKTFWGLFSSESMAEAVHKAVELGNGLPPFAVRLDDEPGSHGAAQHPGSSHHPRERGLLS